MSALDKAFIKAYTKDLSPPAAGSDDRAANLTSGGYVDWYETIPATPADGPHGQGLAYRIDDPHEGPQGLRLTPHAAFSSSYTDPAYVTPYHASSSTDAARGRSDLDPSGNVAEAARAAAAVPNTPGVVPPPAIVPAVVPAPAIVPAAVPPPAVVPAAARQVEEAPKAPATAGETPALHVAETTTDPSQEPVSVAPAERQRSLKIRTLFSTAEPDADSDAEAAFSPDWEVDSLAWPAICHRLLEAEERYFSSVGQRLKSATEDSHHVVMITGARRGEGRTTLALCLARCAAQAGVPTALVDADLKNPKLGSRLGMETPCSWLEVVAGKAPLSEAAVTSIEDQMTLFPLTGSEDLEVAPGDPQWISVLRTIATHYPLVIVDTGPLGSDGRHLFASDDACPIDTAIVVRDLRNTTERKAIATAESLQRSGVAAVGIAENFRAAAAFEESEGE